MKQKLLLLACTFLSTMLFSQSEQKAFLDWSTTAGSQNFFYKNITKTDAFGNVYVAGATIDSLGATDLLLAKYNSSGVQLWIKQYGTPGYHDFAGGLYVTDNYAYVTGAVTTNTTYLTTDLLTIVYTASGTVQWSATYDGGNNLHEAGKDIRADVSGNVYVTGGGYNASLNTDFLTVKYNSSGTQQWVNAYNYSSGLDDAAYKISLSGSNVLVSGAVTQSANNYKYNTITLTQSSGSLTAVNTSSATTTNSVDVVSDLVIDGSGNAYLAGATNVSGQGYNYYILKMATSNLTTQWQTTWNGSDNLDDVARAIQVDASGNVYVTGYSTTSAQGRNMVTKKYNSSGTLQWTETYNSDVNGDDEGADMIIDASGYIYITGYTASEINQKDYYTIKYNSSGTKIWDIQNDANHTNDAATNMTLDSLNNVIVTGYTETGVGTYKYYTARFVQKDVITPTDYNLETPNPAFMYYQNKGQVVDTNLAIVSDIKFYTHHTYPSFYIKKNSMTMVFTRANDQANTDTLQRIDMNFDNVKNSSKTYPMEEQKDGYLNYFLGYLGNDITAVFGNKRLITPEIYTNIDLMYSSNQNGIKYYFIVKPGGNPADIAMTFTGATSYSLNGSTNALSINSSIGSLTYDRPTVYQLTAGNGTVAVGSWTPAWQTNGAVNKYTFNSGSYTSSLTLIIEIDQGNGVYSQTSTDNIEWSTYFGGTMSDAINDIKSGASNNLFVVGQGQNAALPQGAGITLTDVFQANNKGLRDAFIAKFNQNGVLKWRTYVGGAGDDNLNSFDIASNGLGDLYCVGTTKSTVLLTQTKTSTTVNNSSHATAGADRDGMIFQLDQNNGKNCQWFTYYGGNGDDALNACKFDTYGNLFIVGSSKSTNLQVVGTSPQYTVSYVDTQGNFDGYIMKLNNASSDIDWATYIGSSNASFACSSDYLAALDFNTKNDVYIGGGSTGDNFPITHSAGSTTLTSNANCLSDAIIMQFNNNGNILWSTYFGGLGSDQVTTIKADGDDIYLGGYTDLSLSTFPTLFSGNLYANTTKSLTTDPYAESGYLVYFDGNNHAQHSTLIGGDDGDDQIQDIEIDSMHNIYLIGSTESTSLDAPPGGNPSSTWTHNNNGLHDQFIFVVQQGTTDPIWSTEIGGDFQEMDVSSTIDGLNRLFLAGSAQSQVNFPWNNGGGYPVHFQGSLTGPQYDYDGCITRLALSPVNFVGIKENQNFLNGISLYPNPTNGNLTIQLSEFNSNKKFTIFNTMGQSVLVGNLSNKTSNINVSNLAEGMYFIEIIDKTSKATAKFIKH